MRSLIALFAVLLLGAGAPDWGRSAVRTPDGTYLVGNPHAAVTLVEYVSLTCPHCAKLSGESGGTVDAMIADGSLRVELRHAVRDPLDLAATLIARCTGPAKLRETMGLLFALQPQWAPAGEAYMAAHPSPSLLQISDGAGLTQIARGFGLERPRIAACLASQPDRLAVAHIADASWKVMSGHSTPTNPAGTPSFAINGRYIGSTDWLHLETQLRQAGAH